MKFIYAIAASAQTFKLYIHSFYYSMYHLPWIFVSSLRKGSSEPLRHPLQFLFQEKRCVPQTELFFPMPQTLSLAQRDTCQIVCYPYDMSSLKWL